jgi:hypothetical protein
METPGDSLLPMNVSKSVDEAYIAEKEIRLSETFKGWPVGTCSRCSGTIHNAPYLSQFEAGEFCSRKCRDLRNETETRHHRSRHFRECLGCGRKFLAKWPNNTTCSARCRQKAHRGVGLSPMSQIPKMPLLAY